jgi:hypothetical protein
MPQPRSPAKAQPRHHLELVLPCCDGDQQQLFSPGIDTPGHTLGWVKVWCWKHALTWGGLAELSRVHLC